jgi:hypothetical protein
MAANSLFTLEDLALEVSKNIGDTSEYTLADAKKWINRAIMMFTEMGEWSFQRVYGPANSVNTVANTATVEIDNVLKITSIYSASPVQRTLTLIEDRTFRARFPNPNATGTPYYWRIAGRKADDSDTQIIGVYPVPDGVYTLYFDAVRPISLLVNDSDDIRTVTKMPSTYVNLVIEIATAIGYKRDDDVKSREQLEECAQRLQSLYYKDQDQIDDRLITRPLEADDMAMVADPLLPPTFTP